MSLGSEIPRHCTHRKHCWSFWAPICPAIRGLEIRIQGGSLYFVWIENNWGLELAILALTVYRKSHQEQHSGAALFLKHHLPLDVAYKTHKINVLGCLTRHCSLIPSQVYSELSNYMYPHRQYIRLAAWKTVTVLIISFQCTTRSQCCYYADLVTGLQAIYLIKAHHHEWTECVPAKVAQF